MLTQKAKYAIKALVYLAKKGGLVKTQEIAEQANVPKKFLEAILLELKSRKIVASQQGAAGGYLFLRDPAEVNIAEIYRIFEGPVALVSCASEEFYQPCTDCVDEQTCVVRKAMKQIRQQTLKAMEGVTILKMKNDEIT